ncbi:hypothetical protein ACLMJK_003093 [Lecanora helva]
MSDYPAVPQFGTSFPPYYDAPASEISKTGVRPYTFQSRMQAPSSNAHVQASSTSTQPVPQTNAYSFHANAQGAARSGYGVNGTSSYHDQIYPHTIPSHPSASEQTALHNLSVSQSSVHTPTHSAIPQSRVHPLSDPSSKREPIKNQAPPSEPVKSVVSGDSDLEDGEVDDHEFEKSFNPSDVTEMGTVFSRSSSDLKTQQNLPDVGLSKRNEHESNNELSISLNQDSQFESEIRDPSLHNSLQPPFAKGNTTNVTVTKSSTSTSDSKVLANGTGNRQNFTDAQLSTLKSKEAQQALLDLHSYGHNFDQIVARGMNPEILRTIYATAGIPVQSSSSSQSQQATLPGISVEDRAMHEKQPLNSQSESLTRTNALPSEKVPSDLKANPLPTQPKQEEAASTIDPATGTKPAKTIGSNFLAKRSGSSAPDAKSMDRKDYIARMLAAKTGKAAGPSKSSTPPKASEVVMRTETNDPPTASSAAANVNIPVNNSTAQSSNQQLQIERASTFPQPFKNDADAEAKRKAKTDLARQKMEALKLQQEARKANIDNLTNSSSLASQSISRVPAVAPVTASQPPASSRQISYFSPISQKAPFSIPGLFMTEEPTQTVLPPDKEPKQQGVGSDLGLSLNPMATSMRGANQVDRSIVPDVIPRKRQKAADFLDSPPTRVKKPLKQQANSSVIIDISDDEMIDASEVDSMDVDLSENRGNAFQRSQADNTGPTKQKNLRSLPPLSDITPKKRTPAVTPPIVPIMNQAQGLKSKELEIQSMNRKIKELEQRINAKKTTSRNHTPGPIDHLTKSPPDQQSTEEKVAAPPTNGLTVEDDENVNSASSQKGSSKAIEHAYAITAEQQLQEVELAKAEAERSLVVDIAKASDSDAKAQQAQSQVSPKVSSAALENRESRDAEGGLQEAVDQQLSRGSKEDHGSLDEARVVQKQDDLPMEDAPPKVEQLEVSDGQRQQRRIAIESGLPLLDATVEMTKRKLDSLRKEIEILEVEVRKGVEGRKALVEELESLSIPSKPQRTLENRDKRSLGSHVDKGSTNDAVKALKTASSPDQNMDDSLPQPESPKASDTLRGQLVSPQDVHYPSTPLPQAADQDLNEDLGGDSMDISRSEIDEGESSNYSPTLLRTEVRLSTGSNEDDEENYEPPGDISVVQQQDPTPVAAQPQKTSQKVDPSDIATELPYTDKQEKHEPDFTNGSTFGADIIGYEHDNSERGPSLLDVSDSDDYEPPEPTALPSEPHLHPQAATSPKASSPLASAKDNDDVLLGEQDSDTMAERVDNAANAAGLEPEVSSAPKSDTPFEHFTPYESPLQQFKAFRNHPDYLKKVSHGFRSLTYNHSANPDVPMCRYELDGVCNDSSCESQHFKSIGLIGITGVADEKILVDLGTLPKRSDVTALDATAYTDGLRKLIQDIRNRRVRDVNEVASEITAYRRQFLGEFRILSL